MTQPSSGAARHWPLFDLVLRTPRLTLRYVDDERAASLMNLAADGVHDPGVMPFMTPWTRSKSPLLEREGMQGYWQDRATLRPDAWNLPFAVYEGDALAGAQDLRASSCAVTRTASSASWLARRMHGRGIGKEMRAAVLHLAFSGLGAEFASSGAFVDNMQSIGVTKALGYVDNGWQIESRDGKPVRDLRFLLERAVWARVRRDDIEIDGLAPCLPLLGVTSGTGVPQPEPSQIRSCPGCDTG